MNALNPRLELGAALLPELHERLDAVAINLAAQGLASLDEWSIHDVWAKSGIRVPDRLSTSESLVKMRLEAYFRDKVAELTGGRRVIAQGRGRRVLLDRDDVPAYVISRTCQEIRASHARAHRHLDALDKEQLSSTGRRHLRDARVALGITSSSLKVAEEQAKESLDWWQERYQEIESKTDARLEKEK